MANAMINKPNSKWLVMVEYRKKLSRYPITVSFLDTISMLVRVMKRASS